MDNKKGQRMKELKAVEILKEYKRLNIVVPMFEQEQVDEAIAELQELTQEKSKCIEPINDCLGCKWQKIYYDGEPCQQCARAVADHYTPKG
jgi:hypothetical protein